MSVDKPEPVYERMLRLVTDRIPARFPHTAYAHPHTVLFLSIGAEPLPEETRFVVGLTIYKSVAIEPGVLWVLDNKGEFWGVYRLFDKDKKK